MIRAPRFDPRRSSHRTATRSTQHAIRASSSARVCSRTRTASRGFSTSKAGFPFSKIQLAPCWVRPWREPSRARPHFLENPKVHRLSRRSPGGLRAAGNLPQHPLRFGFRDWRCEQSSRRDSSQPSSNNGNPCRSTSWGALGWSLLGLFPSQRAGENMVPQPGFKQLSSIFFVAAALVGAGSRLQARASAPAAAPGDRTRSAVHDHLGAIRTG